MMVITDVTTGLQLVEVQEGWTIYVPRPRGEISLTFEEYEQAYMRIMREVKGREEGEHDQQHPDP